MFAWLEGRAQDATWTGTAPGNWSAVGSWSAGVPTGTATFNLTGTNAVVVDQATNVNGVLFSGSSGTWNFSGSTLTIGGSAVGSGSRPLHFSSAITANFANTVAFSSSSTASSLSQIAFSPSSTADLVVDFAGGLSGNASISDFTLRTSGTNNGVGGVNVRIGGLANIGTFAWGTSKSTLELYGASTVATKTLIAANNVTLRLAHTSALGTGQLELNHGGASGAVITLQAAGANRTYSNGLVLNGGFSNPDSGSGVGKYVVSGDYDLKFTGVTTLSRAAAIEVQGGRRFELAGDVVGSRNLIKQGTGTLVLSGNSIAGNDIAVEEGTLLVNGIVKLAATPDVIVTDAGVLGGIGSIGRDVVFGLGTVGAGVLNPGDAFVNNGIGTLTITDNRSLTLHNDTLLNFDIGAGGAHDSVVINGNLTLDGILNISDAGLDQIGSFTLMSYTGTLIDNGLLVGNMPAGWTYNLSVDEVAKIVRLNVTSISSIPEPATAQLLAGLGVLAAVALLRRERRK